MSSLVVCKRVYDKHNLACYICLPSLGSLVNDISTLGNLRSVDRAASTLTPALVRLKQTMGGCVASARARPLDWEEGEKEEVIASGNGRDKHNSLSRERSTILLHSLITMHTPCWPTRTTGSGLFMVCEAVINRPTGVIQPWS